MAEVKKTTGGRAKLPPLNPNAGTEDADKPKKKVVKKKKKPVTEDGTEGDADKPKPAARKKKAASADSTGAESADKPTPRKKKRQPKKTDEAETDVDPTSARSGGSQGEDVAGSKASLIKSPKDGTPRKKKAKKKTKKPGEESGESNMFDSTLAADLSALQDDIVSHDAKLDEEEEEEEGYKQPYSTASHVLRSQPTEKFYIETDSGFKGESKNRFAKRQAEEAKEKAIIHEEPKNTTIEFAISTQKVIRTFSLFCHGLLAGFGLWHMVMAYMLLDFDLKDFMLHYRKLALPVQTLYYILLVICTISALDRFDLASPSRRFLLKALTLQNGTISVLLYMAALIISLSNMALEDKIHLYDMKPQLWNVSTQAAGTEDLHMWRDLNTARNVLAILGWFVISITPLVDRLTENLRQTDEEDLLGVEVETHKSAMA